MRFSAIRSASAALALWPVGAALAATHSSQGFEYGIDQPPSWVEEAPLPRPSADSSRSSQGVEYLLYSEQTRLATDGHEFFTRAALLATSPDGLGEASEISVDFDPTYQSLVLHRIDVLRAGARQARLSADTVSIIQRETGLEQRLYDGRVTALVVLEDVREGDIVEYAYTVRGDNPVFGNRFFAAHALQWEAPLALQRLRVLVPAPRELRYRVFGGSNPPRIIERQDLTEYLWEQRDLPALRLESDTPPWHLQGPWVQLSEYRSWNEVARWAAELYAQRQPAQGRLAEKIAEWREAGENSRALLDALDFVQEEIRYFGYEFGENSHLPSSPADVYENRYGDCKDKSLLLATIYRQLDTSATPALVSAAFGRLTSELLPSPGAFDHVIVRIETPTGIYWIDPTRTHQRGGLEVRAVGDFGAALLVDPDARELVPVDTSRQAHTSVHVLEEFSLGEPPAPLALSVSSRYRGPRAETMRYVFASGDSGKLTSDYTNYYARMFEDVEPSGEVVLEEDPQLGEVLVREGYSLGTPWDESGDAARIWLNADTIDPYVELPAEIKRSTPLALAYPVELVHEAIVRHPSSVTIAVDEAPIVIEDDFIHYRLSFTQGRGQVTVKHEYRSKRDHVPAASVPEHVKKLRSIREQLVLEATFASASGVPLKSRYERLRDLIRGGDE